jgi:hypothetical protein
MSIELICNALGLPPDRWPPDHYALLGLPAGDVDSAAVEERVLDRMERLRRYQLAHPDAVTDAMNRLAQALVCLTDPAAKAAYDATLRPTAQAARAEIPAPDEEPPLPYALAPPERLAVPRIVHRPMPVRPRPDDPRRQLYRRLAATRRLLTAWREVGDYIADPAGRPLRPTEGIEFVGAVVELRARLADDASPPIGLPGQLGADVAALTRQHLPLTTFRHMQREQRSALAADWQAATDQLTTIYAETGRAVRRHRRTASQRALRKAARSLVTDRLDLTLFVLGLAALGLALLRSL